MRGIVEKKATLILAVIETIKRRLREVPSEQFVATAEEQELLAFRLLRIGEYASKMMPAAAALRPEIAWREIIDLRNLLAHDYDSADPLQLRRIAEGELDALERACRALVDAAKDQP